MTSRALYFTLLAALAAAPVSAGIFGNGEPGPAKGTVGEKAAYIEGTQKGLAPHTLGNLVMRDNKAIVFQHGKGTVSIPYADITSTEVGPARGKDAGPGYKVWNVHRRFGDKTRYLTIHYSENGAKNKLVFEVGDKAATLTVSQIEIAQGKREGSVHAAATNDELWWGDKYWRTSRNTDKWNKPGAPEATKSTAPQE